MRLPFTRRLSTFPRLLRVAAIVASAALVVASGTASAQVTPSLRLPSHDPFYTYTGSKPLSQIAPGTVLKKRPITAKITSLTVSRASPRSP
jgi:hypothetical protein